MLKNKNSSILLYTLLILSIITLLTQQLIRNAWVGIFFNSNTIAKEQARVLAISGVNLAISQLTLIQPSKEKTKEVKQKEVEKKALKDFLFCVLPNINRWQIFNLKEKYDGIDGQIKFCICCENGKININQAFDFKKGEFKNEYKILLGGLYLKGRFKEGEILKRLTEFLKDRKRKLDDISQLVNIKGLEELDLFYRPPKLPLQVRGSKSNTRIALQDLFTTWSEKSELELLFLSDSTLAVFGQQRPMANDSKRFKDKFSQLIKVYEKNWGSNWKKNWKFLLPIYGPRSKKIDRLGKILSKEFGPNVYSVLSCGVVNGVEQLLLTVIKEVEVKSDVDNSKKKTKAIDKKKEKVKIRKIFKILRMYWI
ncbi:hypothetical protein KAT08_02245 [Candidatus Babeliales bacterium]|nr:hypothetical protein [Candidatus Babeliales bacterium]